MPTFSIFLPVRNGGAHLHACIESIQGQTCNDFELIVLENHSTDGTAEWLKDLPANDPRVSVIPADKPLSVAENWNRILGIRKCPYMSIIGHDDLYDANFLSEIVKLIDAEPDAALYAAHFRLIDQAGKTIRECQPIPRRESAPEFLAARLARIRDSFGTGYVMRSERYDALGGIPPYRDLMYADDSLWMQLIHESYKATSPQSCFSYRLHSGSISGSPSQPSLFEGLSKHVALLREMATENAEITRVLQRYGPDFVRTACRNYYYYLVKTSRWLDGVPPDKIVEINKVMIDVTGSPLNHSTTSKAQMIIWHWLVKSGRRVLPMIERALNK